jgi:hypothetical protein
VRYIKEEVLLFHMIQEKPSNNREVDDTNILKSFCERFCAIVDRYSRYIIVSGYVAIATGRSRGTEDIDMIVSTIPKETFLALHNELVKNGFECIQGSNGENLFDGYLIEKTAIRYVEKGNIIPNMEVKLAKDIIDDIQLKERIKIPETGVDVWFSSIETNIAFKEEYLQSEKDIEDAEHLRIRFRGKINEKNINRMKHLIKEVRL